MGLGREWVDELEKRWRQESNGQEVESPMLEEEENVERVKG